MLKEILIQKKFTEKEASFLIKKSPNGVTDEELEETIDALLDVFDYSPKEIIRIVRFDSLILILKKTELESGKTRLKKLGYKDEAIKKMITYYPSIVAYDEETLSRMITFLKGFGFTKEQVLKFTSRTSNFYSLSKEYVEKRFAFMESLGFIREEIIRMICFAPMSVKTSDDEFQSTFEFLYGFSVDKKDATKIISYVPSILKPDKSEFDKKLRVIIKSGLYKEFLSSPTSLIQSAELTSARVDYFDNEGIRLLPSIRAHIFMSGEKFKRQYGVTNDQVLATYNLRKDLKAKRKKLEPKD